MPATLTSTLTSGGRRCRRSELHRRWGRASWREACACKLLAQQPICLSSACCPFPWSWTRALPPPPCLPTRFRDYEEQQFQRERMNAERRAKAVAWEWEKEQAQLNKACSSGRPSWSLACAWILRLLWHAYASAAAWKVLGGASSTAPPIAPPPAGPGAAAQVAHRGRAPAAPGRRAATLLADARGLHTGRCFGAGPVPGGCSGHSADLAVAPPVGAAAAPARAVARPAGTARSAAATCAAACEAAAASAPSTRSCGGDNASASLTCKRSWAPA